MVLGVTAFPVFGHVQALGPADLSERPDLHDKSGMKNFTYWPFTLPCPNGREVSSAAKPASIGGRDALEKGRLTLSIGL